MVMSGMPTPSFRFPFWGDDWAEGRGWFICLGLYADDGHLVCRTQIMHEAFDAEEGSETSNTSFGLEVPYLLPLCPYHR